MVGEENPLRVASQLAQEGRTDEAIACLESALARTRSDGQRPTSTSVLAKTAGLLCEVAERLAQAARYYEEAVSTGESDPLPLIALAEVRWRLGQADAARSCLARAESQALSTGDDDAKEMVAAVRTRWESNVG